MINIDYQQIDRNQFSLSVVLYVYFRINSKKEIVNWKASWVFFNSFPVAHFAEKGHTTKVRGVHDIFHKGRETNFVKNAWRVYAGIQIARDAFFLLFTELVRDVRRKAKIQKGRGVHSDYFRAKNYYSNLVGINFNPRELLSLSILYLKSCKSQLMMKIWLPPVRTETKFKISPHLSPFCR